MEASNDGEKGCREGEKRHGGRAEPTGGGEASAGFAAVETATVAKQATRWHQVRFWKSFAFHSLFNR